MSAKLKQVFSVFAWLRQFIFYLIASVYYCDSIAFDFH